jgi:hypothetical protein
MRFKGSLFLTEEIPSFSLTVIIYAGDCFIMWIGGAGEVLKNPEAFLFSFFFSIGSRFFVNFVGRK